VYKEQAGGEAILENGCLQNRAYDHNGAYQAADGTGSLGLPFTY
jgi:hypothetical protein